MKVFHNLLEIGIAPACALTIGNFDGVHRGHQAILAKLKDESRQRGVPSCVLTFEPHPRDYFAIRAGGDLELVSRISSLDDKLAELKRQGIDQVIVLRFDEHIAELSGQAFIEEILIKRLGVRYVLVGDDFCFGARRSGNYDTLEAAGNVHGFGTARMESHVIYGARVSSTLIREALARGDIGEVELLLGRPYVRAQQAKPNATGTLRSAAAPIGSRRAINHVLAPLN